MGNRIKDQHVLLAVIRGGGSGTQPAALRKWIDLTMMKSGEKQNCTYRKAGANTDAKSLFILYCDEILRKPASRPTRVKVRSPIDLQIRFSRFKFVIP